VTLRTKASNGIEDRHTFKAARAKAHRDLDDDLRKRFQQKCSRLKFSHALQT
jgi:hypothetical protein